MIWLWRLVVLCTVFAVVYSAVVLYRVKTETREILRDTALLERRQIELRAEIAALDTEWAYLNAPGTLNRLISRFSDTLQLEDRVPDSFARLSELPPRGARLEQAEGSDQ